MGRGRTRQPRHGWSCTLSCRLETKKMLKTSTPLANTLEHDTPLLCQARDNPAVSMHNKGYCVKARDRLLSQQSTRHMLSQTNRHTAVIKVRDTCCVGYMPSQTIRHTAVIKVRDTCCVKARDTVLCQTTRRTTVSKYDAGSATHTAAANHCCSFTAQHTKPFKHFQA